MHQVPTAKQRSPRARGRRSHAHQRAPCDEGSPCPVPASLQASVLVLNRLYLAIQIVSVRRAFGLLVREAAEVIHLEDGQMANHSFASWCRSSERHAAEKLPEEDWVRAVNFEIQVPRVIRLLAFDRLPRRGVHLSRRTILARDDHRCQFCGRQFPIRLLSIDHVVPKSRGGKTTWENVVCACLKCNAKKGGRTPTEAHMALIRRPTKPRQNPMLAQKLSNPKYESWRSWLDGIHWDLGFGT